MAFTPNRNLNSSTGPIVRDYQHAARLFVDDNFRLLPKQKFLFHVAFNINSAALQTINIPERHRNEINMLVKSCDLPNFNVTADVLNQYNRKKNVQTTIKYQPINITFHDDNMGLVNALWQNYYSYYYGDSYAAQDPAGYKRNATKSYDYINNTYGLDNGSKLPFFNYITIYQMARHEYVSYTLQNPIITQWNHNKVEYSATGAHDNTAQISYESVAYGSGIVEPGDPEGFALEHYDQTPSPLQGGQGLSSASPSFVSPVSSNASEFLSNLTTTINTYQNTQELPTAGQAGVLTNAIQTAQQGVTGLQGVAFPVSSAGAKTLVVAKQVNIVNIVANTVNIG